VRKQVFLSEKYLFPSQNLQLKRAFLLCKANVNRATSSFFKDFSRLAFVAKRFMETDPKNGLWKQEFDRWRADIEGASERLYVGLKARKQGGNIHAWPAIFPGFWQRGRNMVTARNLPARKRTHTPDG